MKKAYVSSEKTGAPLSGAIEAGGLVFVSGQIHADKDWNVMGDTIEEKFDIVMNNIKNILNEANLDLSDIVKLNISITDLGELAGLNKVYGNYFKHPFPARAAVEVKGLPLGADLEIEVVAVARDKSV